MWGWGTGARPHGAWWGRGPTQRRARRSPSNPASAHGGAPCDGDAREVRECHTPCAPGTCTPQSQRRGGCCGAPQHPGDRRAAVPSAHTAPGGGARGGCSGATRAPVPAEPSSGWSAWTPWSPCSRSCFHHVDHRGRRRRFRHCEGPAGTCPGLGAQEEPCDTAPCPGERPGQLGARWGRGGLLVAPEPWVWGRLDPPGSPCCRRGSRAVWWGGHEPVPPQWQASGCPGPPGPSARLPATPACRRAAGPVPPPPLGGPNARAPSSRPATATPSPAEVRARRDAGLWLRGGGPDTEPCCPLSPQRSAPAPCGTARPRSAGARGGPARGCAGTWSPAWCVPRAASPAATAPPGSCCRTGAACRPDAASATTAAASTSPGTPPPSTPATTGGGHAARGGWEGSWGAQPCFPPPLFAHNPSPAAPAWPGRWCAARSPAQVPTQGGPWG